MKRIALVIAAIISLSACEANIFGEKGNGISVNQEINTDEFNKISINSFVDVYYTQTTGEQSITLTCDENLIEYYKVEVRDGELVVDCKNAILNHKVDTYINVCSPTLHGVTVSGSGDLHIDESITVEKDFSLKLSGSGDADIAGINAESATVSISGSGDVEIDNMKVESAQINNSGSGDVEIDHLTAEIIKVTTTGSGDCTLGCKDSGSLDIQISGSGDITLSGSARAIVNISTTGSGNFNMSHLTLSGK